MSVSALQPLPLWRRPEVIIAAGCVIAAMGFGLRSSFGLFTLPITETYGWDRATFGFAIAIQNLVWGATQPVAGAMADRYGTARVLIVGSIIYALGVILMPFSPTPTLFCLTAGVMVGIGIATASFAIVMAAFSRSVGPERRSWAFGIATAAGSMGQFLFAPLGQAFIQAYGWETALVLLGLTMLICVPLAGLLRTRTADAKQSLESETTLPAMQALAKAVAHRSFILLIAGFFVCGFQLAFITTHMPPFLVESGVSAGIASTAIALVGLFNVVGSYTSGILGNRHSKPYLLASIYAARGVAALIFILLPITTASTLVFSAVMGLLWLSTVPPTAALVAIMFGVRYMGMLYGVVFFSHQVGSFMGVWLGGVLYDIYGSYNPVWWISIGLCVFAALVHLPIRERPAADFGRTPVAA
ncbi:MFS family permease [Rhodoligotrophos appendicifer]|uniref:MFS transporter n=1 Tax=Rhodoligotrophos appendicifer TaxID=987056 RepID=UPI001184918C|nr:MFS transporter [Rhodoligotrophos appendicifer]